MRDLKPPKKISIPFFCFSAIVFSLSLNQLIMPYIPQKQHVGWPPPQTIPGYNLETWPPILVADQNRTVHAFSSQWVGGVGGTSYRAVIYNQWTLEQGWTEPIDILLSPIKEARVTDAYLDKNGLIHVVFFGGDGTDANIYYSKAPAEIADDASSWSLPVVIGQNANDPECAVFAETDQGTLDVIYSGRAEGNGLYVVNSANGGETWSNSAPLFFTDSDKPNIKLLKVINSKLGWLHTIWNVYNISGQGRGIYYARSKDGILWSEPVLLAAASDGLGTQTPTIIEYRETLFAVFNLPPKIMMRRSMDNGETWQDPAVMFPRHVGVNGSLSMVIDGNDDLHLFFGQRITGNPDIHGMWHSIWINNRWMEPEALIKGPRVVDKEGNGDFDPYEARAIVSQGNVLLVTWVTDPGEFLANGVWFSYAVLAAPEIPVATLQSYSGLTEIPVTKILPTLALPETEAPQIIINEDDQSQNPFTLTVIGVIALVFCGTIYIIFIRGK